MHEGHGHLHSRRLRKEPNGAETREDGFTLVIAVFDSVTHCQLHTHYLSGLSDYGTTSCYHRSGTVRLQSLTSEYELTALLVSVP